MIQIESLRIALLRPLIWLSRFRHRKGYGVHSPFAFRLITDVVYQRWPYYRYRELAAQEAGLPDALRRADSRKLKRLLFRLVNEAQPQTLALIGTPSAASLYLRAAKADVVYHEAKCAAELDWPADRPLDFLYLRTTDAAAALADFDYCIDRVRSCSLFVVKGIGYNRAMKAAWQQMRRHPKVVVSFDLYDVGLLFFDTEKQRQHYVVNF